jgi:hypothetical protein
MAVTSTRNNHGLPLVDFRSAQQSWLAIGRILNTPSAQLAKKIFVLNKSKQIFAGF